MVQPQAANGSSLTIQTSSDVMQVPDRCVGSCAGMHPDTPCDISQEGELQRQDRKRPIRDMLRGWYTRLPCYKPSDVPSHPKPQRRLWIYLLHATAFVLLLFLLASVVMIFVLLAMVLTAVGSPLAPNHLGRMENLITFGDSYTDEGRLSYFFEHHRAPPLGEMLPPSDHTASGGYAWGRFVANGTGARYYNYAVSGAQCTNNIDSRNLDVINGPFPSVLEYEIPAFEQDIRLPNLYPDRRADNTVYGLWIGTNDIGIDGILGDAQKKGTTLSTYVDCIWSVFDHIYRAGGRHFVLLNLAPLDQAPMYATPDQGGMGNHEFWRNKTAYNVTEYTNKMLEYTTSVNTMFDYGAPFYLKVTQRWQGASFSIFDVYSLMMDVIASPGEYLDAPANVTAPFRTCLNGCVDAPQPKSSFMWYDELHPSERMDDIIARNFVDVVQGKSKYGVTYT